MSQYELCPKCNGTGERYKKLEETSALAMVLNFSLTMSIPYKDKDGNIKFHIPDNVCPVCKGKMIISSTTGLPPIETVNSPLTKEDII
jgi:hypothetical protein